MSLVAYEKLNAVQTSKQFNGDRTATRRFVVNTVDPKAAEGADGIPQPNATHPIYNDCKLDGIAVVASGTGLMYVDAIYSNNRKFGSARQPPKDDPHWYHFGWEQADVNVSYYVNVLEKVNFSDQSSPVDMWTLQKHTATETRIVRPLYVRLSDVFDPRILDPIAAQKNRLHNMPDGKTYRFTGGQVTQVDATTYDVRYEWEFDDGTPLPEELDSDGGRVNIPANDVEGRYLRRPYTVLIPLRSPNARVEPHATAFFRPYTRDADGWRRLPGANRLV